MKEQLTGRGYHAYPEVSMDPDVIGEFRPVGQSGAQALTIPRELSRAMGGNTPEMFADLPYDSLRQQQEAKRPKGFAFLEDQQRVIDQISAEMEMRRRMADNTEGAERYKPLLEMYGVNSVADLPPDMLRQFDKIQRVSRPIRGGAVGVNENGRDEDTISREQRILLDWHNEVFEKTPEELIRDLQNENSQIMGYMMKKAKRYGLEDQYREKVQKEILNPLVAETDPRAFQNAFFKARGDLLELLKKTLNLDVSGRGAVRPDFYSEVLENIAQKKDSDPFAPIKSAKELGMEIMRYGEQGLWGEFGKYPILDPKTGEVNKYNMMRWVREQIYFQHDLNPDDPLQVFRDIQIQTSTRPVSILEVFSNENYMRADEGEPILDWLRTQIMKETWLFPAAHNTSVEYNKQKGSDEELPKIITQIYFNNTFTKRSFGETTMRTVLTLPSMAKREGEEWDPKNQELGKAIRRAFLTYYYISDPEMLQKIWAGKEDSGLRNPFTHKNFISSLPKFASRHDVSSMTESERRELLKEFDKKGEVTKEDSEKFGLHAGFAGREGNKMVFENNDAKNKAFNTDGVVKDIKNIKEYINIFNNPQKDVEAVDEVRARIRQALFESGLDHQEAQYAEAWAYILTSWTGAAARNDLAGIGFDSWTKGQETERYRKRQASGSRAGVHGNRYTIHGVHRLVLNLFEGTFAYADDDSKDPIPLIHIIQGGQGSDVKLDEIANFRMPDNSMRQFAVNHVLRGFSLFHYIAETNFMNFDKFMDVDAFGRVTMNYEEADKVLDNVFKAARYAYSTWDQIDFGATIKTQDGTMTIAEAMFGKQILEKSNGSKMTQSEIREKQKNDRGFFWKSFMRYNVATEIWAHRDYNSPYERYEYKHLHKIYDFIEKIPADYAGNDTDFKSVALKKERFFTKEDIEWIKKQTKTEDWRVFAEEGLFGLFMGLMIGSWGATKTVVGSANK